MGLCRRYDLMINRPFDRLTLEHVEMAMKIIPKLGWLDFSQGSRRATTIMTALPHATDRAKRDEEIASWHCMLPESGRLQVSSWHMALAAVEADSYGLTKTTSAWQAFGGGADLAYGSVVRAMLLFLEWRSTKVAPRIAHVMVLRDILLGRCVNPDAYALVFRRVWWPSSIPGSQVYATVDAGDCKRVLFNDEMVRQPSLMYQGGVASLTQCPFDLERAVLGEGAVGEEMIRITTNLEGSVLFALPLHNDRGVQVSLVFEGTQMMYVMLKCAADFFVGVFRARDDVTKYHKYKFRNTRYMSNRALSGGLACQDDPAMHCKYVGVLAGKKLYLDIPLDSTLMNLLSDYDLTPTSTFSLGLPATVVDTLKDATVTWPSALCGIVRTAWVMDTCRAVPVAWYRAIDECYGNTRSLDKPGYRLPALFAGMEAGGFPISRMSFIGLLAVAYSKLPNAWSRYVGRVCLRGERLMFGFDMEDTEVSQYAQRTNKWIGVQFRVAGTPALVDQFCTTRVISIVTAAVGPELPQPEVKSETQSCTTERTEEQPLEVPTGAPAPLQTVTAAPSVIIVVSGGGKTTNVQNGAIPGTDADMAASVRSTYRWVGQQRMEKGKPQTFGRQQVWRGIPAALALRDKHILSRIKNIALDPQTVKPIWTAETAVPTELVFGVVIPTPDELATVSRQRRGSEKLREGRRVMMRSDKSECQTIDEVVSEYTAVAKRFGVEIFTSMADAYAAWSTAEARNATEAQLPSEDTEERGVGDVDGVEV
jgi:hypothetical protein